MINFIVNTVIYCVISQNDDKQFSENWLKY